MNELIIDILGWTGAILLVAAYMLVSSERASGRSIPYQSLNLLGSVLLIINAIYHAALPSAGLNCVWIGIAISTLIKTRRNKTTAN